MLCSVGAADVPSGEEPMRDINPADAASASPLGDELPERDRVHESMLLVRACLVVLSLPLALFFRLGLSLVR